MGSVLGEVQTRVRTIDSNIPGTIQNGKQVLRNMVKRRIKRTLMKVAEATGIGYEQLEIV